MTGKGQSPEVVTVEGDVPLKKCTNPDRVRRLNEFTGKKSIWKEEDLRLYEISKNKYHL